MLLILICSLITAAPLYSTDMPEIAGAEVWLFAVPDGNSSVALSSERNGKLVMAPCDLLNLQRSPNWTEVTPHPPAYRWHPQSACPDSMECRHPLADGKQIVVARKIKIPIAHGDHAVSGPMSGSDDGDIVKYVVDANGICVSQTILASHANRPHCVQIGDFIVTTWDSQRRPFLSIEIYVNKGISYHETVDIKK
jgi:hypothetical protein